MPITTEEVEKHLKRLSNKAPGPDYFTVSDLKSTDPEILCAIYNFYLLRGFVPSVWKSNRTTLIPKKPTNLESTSNWWPITISSVILRLLHKILAQRMVTHLHLNERQKAFLPFFYSTSRHRYRTCKEAQNQSLHHWH